jgi:hypothetical protein
LSRSRFSVNHGGSGSGGAHSLLTAPRARTNPGAVASAVPGEVIFLSKSQAALVPLTLDPVGAYRLQLRRRAISTGGVRCCKWSEEIEGAAHPGRCAQLGCPILRFSGADSCKDVLTGLVMTRQRQWGALFFCSLSFAGLVSRRRHGLRSQ